jgi:hypothetical protein
VRPAAAAAVGLLVATLLVAPPARADGDPASDILLADNVFLSFTQPRDSPEGRALEGLTAEARQRRFPIKVAVIVDPTDLGAAAPLYGHAQRYAQFLGRELSFVYEGTLIVTMSGKPGGFGIWGPGDKPPARHALRSLKLPAQRDAASLGRVTEDAVRTAAAANGHPLKAIKERGGHNTRDRLVIGLVGLMLAGAVALLSIRAFRVRRR